MFNNKIKLKIITPRGVFLEKLVDMVTIKTISGYIGILHGHIPFISVIVSSEMHYFIDNKIYKLNITNGILNVKKEFVKIITDDVNLINNFN